MAVTEKIPDRIRARLFPAIKEHGWPLYLHGQTGTGKTCIAALVYQRYIGNAVWFSCRSLLRELAAWRADLTHQIPWLMPSGLTLSRPATNAWDALTNPDWLVCLDDMGTRELSPAQSEILLDLLDARIGKPLIVTGNHDRDGLKFLDPRIVSRVCAGTVIGLVGKDQRKPTSQLEASANG